MAIDRPSTLAPVDVGLTAAWELISNQSHKTSISEKWSYGGAIDFQIRVTAEDLREANRLREAGAAPHECCPLIVALRRMTGTNPVLTRRFVLLDGFVLEPSDRTKRRENAWVERGAGRPYTAVLNRRTFVRPRAPPRRLFIEPYVDHITAGRRSAHRWLEHFANNPDLE